VSPDLSPQEKISVGKLVGLFKQLAPTKRCFRQDFVIMLRETDLPIDVVERHMIWMFKVSQWASESPNWKGPYDIRSSGDYTNPVNFWKSYDQFLIYVEKQQVGQAEQREREAGQEEHDHPFTDALNKKQGEARSKADSVFPEGCQCSLPSDKCDWCKAHYKAFKEDASFDDDDGDEEVFRSCQGFYWRT
jgi:hypothetical protein